MVDSPMHRYPLIIVILFCTCVVLAQSLQAAPADARVVKRSSGRSLPVEVELKRDAPTWAVSVDAGLAAGGDLFSLESGAGASWLAPLTLETFTAKRFTVTLDESMIWSVALARRITSHGWLRADLSISEMDATALANDTQFVSLFLYDRLTFTQAGLAWEQRLLDTPLTPFLLIGATYLDVDATATYLQQSRVAARGGAGVIYSLSDMWCARFEMTDSIMQLESGDVMLTDIPVDSVHGERGPQHLVKIGFGLVASF